MVHHSDRLSRPVTYILFFALEILAFFALSATTSSFVFKGLVLFIISAYGGGFSCMPAYLSDLFGTKQLSAIHGRILLPGQWQALPVQLSSPFL